MPFRWPNTWHDLMLVTEVAAKRPKNSSEWDAIAEILSPHFSKEKQVHLTGRACRERLSRLIDKFLDEDKKALKRYVILLPQYYKRGALFSQLNESAL